MYTVLIKHNFVILYHTLNSFAEGIPRDEGMSIGVKIGVTVISVAAAITLLLLIYKFIKLRCETKDIENQSQRSPNGSDPGSLLLTNYLFIHF